MKIAVFCGNFDVLAGSHLEKKLANNSKKSNLMG
jgi:hypothetical protein